MRRHSTDRPRTVVDLFAGAGGLSLGFRRAGFRVLFAVESEKHAAETYRRNNADVVMFEAEISRSDPMTCLERACGRGAKITAIVCGAPCQGFSESNRRTRNATNPKNRLYLEFIRFLGVLRPEWFVFENVAGLRTLSGGDILDALVMECRKEGYQSAWRELDAQDFGVPQHRRRIFVVGNRVGHLIRFPEPTHGEGRRKPVTVHDAISDLPVLRNGASVDVLPYRNCRRAELSPYQRMMRCGVGQDWLVHGNLVTRNSLKVLERYRQIRQGQNWMAIPTHLMRNYRDASRCHTGIYHRLEGRRPARVIGNFRKNMLIHPTQNRGLSVREAARLQSFPDHYIFAGSIGFQQQQVADAVPPLLAQAVASSILASCEK